METCDLEYFTICQSCGCVFDFVIAIRDKKENETNQVSVCPCCKYEYDLPKKN